MKKIETVMELKELLEDVCIHFNSIEPINKDYMKAVVLGVIEDSEHSKDILANNNLTKEVIKELVGKYKSIIEKSALISAYDGFDDLSNLLVETYPVIFPYGQHWNVSGRIMECVTKIQLQCSDEQTYEFDN